MHSPSRPSTAQPSRARASGVHAAIAGRQHQTPPPVLASEVLREDLAPIEPGQVASRIWSGGAALVLATVGLCLRWDLGVSGVRPNEETLCLAVAAALAATAVVPLSYVWRAIVGSAVCLTALVAGLFGGGPLALMAVPGFSGTWAEVFRCVAAVVLPAAIFFRCHYRAYGRGRLFLGAAFLLALPFLIDEAALLLTAARPVAQIGPGATIAIVIVTAFAFLGTPNPSAATMCAVLLGISASLDIAMRQVYLPPPAGSGPYSQLLTAAAFVACTAPVAMGLFQLLATKYAPDARLVDVRQPPPEDQPPTSRPPDSIAPP
jgi:hypothetical protein